MAEAEVIAVVESIVALGGGKDNSTSEMLVVDILTAQ
jgi:hypothetical protein